MEETSTCKSCGNSMSSSDNYCSNCGNNTDLMTASPNRSQLLVFLSIAFLFATSFIWFLVDMIYLLTNSDGIFEITDAISYFTRLLMMSIGLLLALSMKKGAMKTLAIIFASVFTLIELYWYIKSLIPEEPVDYFQF
ncbi:MAG: hypothetical protein ACI865_003046 [Flavobacteriaceae bacterium]|jgi:hypothetical protein